MPRKPKVRKKVQLDCGAITVEGMTEHAVDEAIKRLKRHDNMVHTVREVLGDLKEVVDQASPRPEDWPTEMDLGRRKLLNGAFTRLQEVSNVH